MVLGLLSIWKGVFMYNRMLSSAQVSIDVNEIKPEKVIGEKQNANIGLPVSSSSNSELESSPVVKGSKPLLQSKPDTTKNSNIFPR